MKRLIVMRHAKSSWDHPGLDDHQRPLNARGQKAAAAIGLWLAKSGYTPDAILSSDSQRTRETWSIAASTWPNPPEPDWQGALYLASAPTLLATLQAATTDTVMILAHNPGIAEFAGELLRTQPNHPRFDQYPTGATLVADLPISHWKEADWRKASPVDFIVPRDLETS